MSVPNAPTDVRVTWFPTSPAHTAVVWTSVTNATSYNVYRGVDGVEPSFLGSVSIAHYRDFDVAPSHDYAYYVTAVNADGESVRSSLVSVHSV